VEQGESRGDPSAGGVGTENRNWWENQ